MAGHSKWANIKHKKQRMDAKKGKVFSRVTKEIISAVKQGGSDPKTNPKLRMALDKAKSVNLPNENIERNIKKASNSDQSDFTEMSYELYGHGGVGIIVEAMTDNKNRTASEMRIATNKRGGSIAEPGSVAFNFDRKGVIFVARSAIDEETLFLAASDAGADDFEASDEGYFIVTPPEQLEQVRETLSGQGIAIQDASLEWLPKMYVECSEEDKQSNEALIEWIDGIDDVDTVYHNMR